MHAQTATFVRASFPQESTQTVVQPVNFAGQPRIWLATVDITGACNQGSNR